MGITGAVADETGRKFGGDILIAHLVAAQRSLSERSEFR